MTRFSGSGLTCQRGDRTVFAGLDFGVASGEALVLSGANGTGKSSLLRLMAGLGRPVAGAIRWDEDDIADDPERHAQRLHYVGHLDAVKPALTAMENIAIWGGLRGAGRRSAETASRAALDWFGLDALAEVPARLLSAGQRRRVALSRVLCAPARLWLLDEPTVALDRAAVAALMGAIARHREDGGLIVLSSNVDIAIADARLLAVDGFAAREAAWEVGA